jgi:hypothetical protein
MLPELASVAVMIKLLPPTTFAAYQTLSGSTPAVGGEGSVTAWV